MTINVTCCKIKDSANLHPSSSRIYVTKRATSSTTAIQSYTWNKLSVSPTSIVFCRSINRHGWKTTSTPTPVNVQLRKMILKKISLSWWTARSLVSLLHVYYLFSYIDSFIVGKVFIFMFLCSYLLIHSLQVFYLYVYLFRCIDSFTDSFILATISIFMFICSYVLIHSLIHPLLVKQWKIWETDARWT